MTTAWRDAPFPYAGIAAALLALAAWLTPTHGLPWPTFHAEVAMAAAGLVAAGWVLWRTRDQPASLPALSLLTLILALVPLAQLATGMIAFRGDAALPVAYLSGFALAQIVGQRAASIWGIERPMLAWGAVALLGALLSMWLVLCQWQQLDYFGFALSELPTGSRPFANFNQPNLLATLLVLGLFGGATLYDAGYLGRVTAALITFVLGFGLAMTQSRAGWLELLLVGALLLVRRRALTRHLGWRGVVAGAALIVSATFAWSAVRAIAPEAPMARSTGELVQIGTRGPHWLAMLDASRRQPWFGYGWDQAAAAQYAVAPDHPPSAEGVFEYGHNLALDLVVWNGWPIGGLVIGALALWFVAAARGARESTSLLALASVVAVFAHAMVEFPLYHAFFLFPVGALMGGLCRTTMPAASLSRIPRGGAALLLAACAALFLVLGSDYLGLESDLQSLRYQQARIGLERPQREPSSPLLLDHVGAFAHFARTPERQGMSDAELAAMADVVHRYPSENNIVRYAAALALNHRGAQASEALRRVCRMSRPPGCTTMKALWLRLGERDAAIGRVAWPD